MIETIYIERDIAQHARTQAILSRLPHATQIYCDRYGEIFNRKAQNFRLQKQRPALILAQKFKRHVLPTPAKYGMGSQYNYYFSHMLNCLYDCRYCFLQGMYRSAHYVVFVNFEEFAESIQQQLAAHSGQMVHFFSGYDCDSLALDHITEFTDFILPLFRQLPMAVLELRSKSLQIRPLLNTQALKNCVIAYSLSPSSVANTLEHKAPSIKKRLRAMQQLQAAGWQIGLRFDPLIFETDYQAKYQTLFQQVFAVLAADEIHSISIGSFRLPKDYFRTLRQLYPEEKLFAAPLIDTAGLYTYEDSCRQEMLDFCRTQLLRYCRSEQLFICDL